MKYPIDTVTHELPLKAKRGRPSTGAAMTPAERKRAQRARDAKRLASAYASPDGLASISTSVLAYELVCCINAGCGSLSYTILRELTARAQKLDGYSLDPSPVTVTETPKAQEAVTVTKKKPAAKAVTVTKKERAAKAVTVTKKPTIKYCNKATGETWTGRGLQPKWVQAWIAQGRFLDELRV